MLTLLRRCVIATLAVATCSPLAAGDPPEATSPSRDQLQQSADRARAAKEDAIAQRDSVREQLQMIEAQLLETRRSVKNAAQKQKEAEGQLSEQQKAAKEAAEQKEAADQVKQVADEALAKAQAALTPELSDDDKQAAEQELTAAQQAADAANKSAKKAAANSESANNTVQTTQQAIQSAKEAAESAEQQIESLRASIDQTRQQLTTAEQQLALVTEEWVRHQRALERALRAAGEWVSFTEEIAPILHGRCIACHNARTAKGRLNLESFAALLKGGESGAAVEPGDGEFSNLCLLIEDGSMPQDADPLTDEQIALIKRWVTLGAKLDAGIDPSLPLIRVIPKPEQPAAPETYRAAIPVTALAFSPDGTWLATSGYHEVLIWDAADGSLVRRIGNVAERIYDLEFHADGRRLAVAAGTPGQMGEVRIVDVTDGALISDLITVGDALFAATFSPDGMRLAAAGADRAIRLFNLETGVEETLIEDHADWVLSVAWSPDGTRLASASRDKTAKLFDAATGDAQLTFNGHGDVVYGIGFLPDGTQVATVGADDRIRIWDVDKADQKREIKGFGNDIFQIQVLADGRSIACGADRTARLHTTADGKEVRKYAGHDEWVYAVAAHPQSKRLATGSYDGEVRLWNLDDGQTRLTFRAAPGFQPVSTKADAAE